MRLKNATHPLRSFLSSPAGLRDTIIEAGLLLAIIIAPLYFNPRTQHTFEPDKAALLRSIVLIAFLAWLVRGRMENGKWKVENGEWREERENPCFLSPFSLFPLPVILPPLLLLAAYLISTVASVLPRISLWGAYERGQGLYILTTYIALFFLGREVVGEPVRRQRLIDTVLLVSLPISVYAILQHFGLDPVVFQTGGAAVTARAISTLGNPIFLGAYLVMVIPVTLLQIYRGWQPAADSQRQPVLMGLYGALLIIQMTAFFFAQSRGPTLGIIGGLGIGALIGTARLATRRVMAGVVIILVAGLVLFSLLPAVAPDAGALGWLGRLIDPTSRTARQRLLIWEGTLSLVTDHPARLWIGYGPETLREMVGPYMPAEIAALKPDEEFDRAHNALLDLWATTGLFGVTTYLLILATCFYWGMQSLGFVGDSADRWLFWLLAVAGTLLGGLGAWFGLGRQWVGVTLPLGLLSGVVTFVMWHGLCTDRRHPKISDDELLAVALLAVLAGHIVETLVGIAIVSTQTLFWIYAAMLAGLATNVRRGPAPTETVRAHFPRRSLPRSPVPSLLGPVWGLITGVVLGLFSFSVLSASGAQGGLVWGLITSVTLLFGVIRFGLGQPGEVVAGYIGLSAAVTLGLWLLIWLPWPPLDITHPTMAVFAYVLIALIALAMSLGGSIARARARIQQQPRPRWALYGALIGVALFVIWLTNVNPIRADVYYKQGLGMSAASDAQGTVQMMRKSIALAPHEDRYYSGIGAGYAQMAQTAEDANTREAWLLKAETYLQQAQQLDPYRADHLRNLGLLYRIWAQLGAPEQREPRLRKALTYYQRAAMRNPVSVRIWREWGEIYAALGEWDMAIQRYETSLRLNRGFVETWLLLARAKLHTADYGGARQAYNQALALDQTRVLQEHQKAVAQSSSDPMAHQALALVYAALGRRRAALAEMEVARDLMAEEPPNWDQFLQALQ